MKTVEIKQVTDEEAYAIVRRELQRVVDKLIRRAHKAGARGRVVRAEHLFKGSLLDASVQLGEEFERIVRSCVPGDGVWHMSFGYTLRHHAVGVMIISLR